MITGTEQGHGLKHHILVESGDHAPGWRRTLVPCAVFCGMVSALFLLAAILPLEGLKFPDVQLTQLGSWPLLPTHILFPRAPIALFAAGKPVPGTLNEAVGWKDTGTLLEAFVILFLCYLLALRWLPRQISCRHIGRRVCIYCLCSHRRDLPPQSIDHPPDEHPGRSRLSFPLLDTAAIDLRTDMDHHHLSLTAPSAGAGSSRHPHDGAGLACLRAYHAPGIYLAHLLYKRAFAAHG